MKEKTLQLISQKNKESLRDNYEKVYANKLDNPDN